MLIAITSSIVFLCIVIICVGCCYGKKQDEENLKKNKVHMNEQSYVENLPPEEPIYLEDKIIGRSTSGNYSFNFKKNL